MPLTHTTTTNALLAWTVCCLLGMLLDLTAAQQGSPMRPARFRLLNLGPMTIGQWRGYGPEPSRQLRKQYQTGQLPLPSRIGPERGGNGGLFQSPLGPRRENGSLFPPLFGQRGDSGPFSPPFGRGNGSFFPSLFGQRKNGSLFLPPFGGGSSSPFSPPFGQRNGSLF
ncbi:unnamed protein product, partial [Ixodes persulcatus]